ncbi:MAG TPA: hypothetical protein VJ962_08020 [Clostridia bacterium]|nr:hypothetical protein [Clostridia bacterium]
METNFYNFNDQDKNKFYGLLKKADQDYPVEPLFSNLAGYMAANLEKPSESLDYLLKHYRIVKEDLSHEVAFLICNLLIELRRCKKAEEITEEFLAHYKSPILYMKLAEVKMELNKNQEGIKYLEKGYKKTNNDIFYLNDIIDILIKKRNYKKAYQLLVDDFYRFNHLDVNNNQNQAELAKYMVDKLHSITERISTKEYKQYLEDVIKVFEIIDFDQKLTEEKINQIKEIIGQEIDLGYYLERLCFYNNEFRFVSINDQVIFNLTEKKDKINHYIIRANFDNKDYQKVIKNFKNMFTNDLLQSKNQDDLKNIFSLYITSIYVLKDNKEMKEAINIINKTIDDDILEFIKDSLTTLNKGIKDEILQYIKEINDEKYISNQNVIDSQLSVLLDTFARESKTFLTDKRQKTIKNFLEEFKIYDTNTFIYHYAIWYLAKSKEEKTEKSIEEIIKYPAGSAESLLLKYLVIIKFGNPNIIFNNPPQRNKLSKKDYNHFEMLAKFKKGELDNLNQAIEKYSTSFELIIKTLILIID